MNKFKILCTMVALIGFFLTGCHKTQESYNDLKEESKIISESEYVDKYTEENIDNIPETHNDTEQKTEDISETENDNQYEPIDLNAEPYEVGRAVVIMYHAVVEGEPPSKWQRNKEDFREDLEKLYDRGYRLMSLRDLMDNNVTVGFGATPAVITFDDGLSESFSLVLKDGELVPKEGTGLYILEEFAKEHPDFGCTATFYINNEPFPGDGTVTERLNWLVDNGYDIGNHTLDHADLKETSSEEIQKQIGVIDKLIKDSVPGYEPVGISYPYGKRPDESLRHFILEGKYLEHTYSYKFALREGDSGAASVLGRIGFDPLNVPRYLGSSGEEGDLGSKLDQFQDNPELRYISDGNSNVISVPDKYKDNIEYDDLIDKEINIYSNSNNE